MLHDAIKKMTAGFWLGNGFALSRKVRKNGFEIFQIIAAVFFVFIPVYILFYMNFEELKDSKNFVRLRNSTLCWIFGFIFYPVIFLLIGFSGYSIDEFFWTVFIGSSLIGVPGCYFLAKRIKITKIAEQVEATKISLALHEESSIEDHNRHFFSNNGLNLLDEDGNYMKTKDGHRIEYWRTEGDRYAYKFSEGPKKARIFIYFDDSGRYVKYEEVV